MGPVRAARDESSFVAIRREDARGAKKKMDLWERKFDGPIQDRPASGGGWA